MKPPNPTRMGPLILDEWPWLGEADNEVKPVVNVPARPTGDAFQLTRQPIDDEDRIEIAAALVDTAVALFNSTDVMNAERAWEAEKARRFNNLASWAAERGQQGALSNELNRWHVDKQGMLQRVVSAADAWKDHKPKERKLRNMVEQYYEGTRAAPAPVPKEQA